MESPRKMVKSKNADRNHVQWGNPADQPHPEITGIKNRKPKKADREGFKTKGAPAIQLPVPQQCSSVKNMVKWR